MTEVFTESFACTCRAHCERCRDVRKGGRQWRLALTECFCLPDNDLNFACPHGVPWRGDPPGSVPLKPRGLGDIIAGIFRAAGLDRIAKVYASLTGHPCRCRERQERLNRLVPFK